MDTGVRWEGLAGGDDMGRNVKCILVWGEWRRCWSEGGLRSDYGGYVYEYCNVFDLVLGYDT